MKTIQRLAFVAAIATTTAAISIFDTSSVQAAIVAGSVTGTWNDSASGAFALGDTFTATYSYDDTTLSPFDNSSVDFVDTGFIASLLTLIVNSGSYSHTFDFTNGFSEFVFRNRALKAPTYTPQSEKLVTVFGAERVGSVEQFFSAGRAPGLYNDIPTLFEGASAGVFDPNTGSLDSYAETSSNVNFSPDPTAVPTPAMLPSLIGLGVGVLRKRRAESKNARLT